MSVRQKQKSLARRALWRARWQVIKAVPQECRQTPAWQQAECYGLATARYRLAMAWDLRMRGDWSAWTEAVSALADTLERVKSIDRLTAITPRVAG